VTYTLRLPARSILLPTPEASFSEKFQRINLQLRHCLPHLPRLPLQIIDCLAVQLAIILTNTDRSTDQDRKSLWYVLLRCVFSIFLTLMTKSSIKNGLLNEISYVDFKNNQAQQSDLNSQYCRILLLSLSSSS
jgi:hypothetical protein